MKHITSWNALNAPSCSSMLLRFGCRDGTMDGVEFWLGNEMKRKWNKKKKKTNLPSTHVALELWKVRRLSHQLSIVCMQLWKWKRASLPTTSLTCTITSWTFHHFHHLIHLLKKWFPTCKPYPPFSTKVYQANKASYPPFS